MEPGLGGADRDADRGRDVGQRHPEVVVQDDDRAQLGSQPPGGRRRAARGRRRSTAMSPIGRSVDRRAARPRSGRRPRRRRMIDAGPDHEPMQPCLEPVRVAERGQAPPRADEALLDRVSRELVVPEDQAGRRVQPRDERAGEHGEGVMIASHALARRALAGPRHPSVDGAATVVALRMVCRAIRRNGSRASCLPFGTGVAWQSTKSGFGGPCRPDAGGLRRRARRRIGPDRPPAGQRCAPRGPTSSPGSRRPASR